MEKGLLVFSALGSLLILFLLVPLTLCLAVGGPGLPELAGDREALGAIATSFLAGLASSAMVAVFGTPLAYVLSRLRSWAAKLAEAVLQVPLALPHSVAGIAVLLAYNSRAPLGALMARAGLVVEDHFWGVVLAMAFVSAPIFISSAKAGFDSVDVELENVARTLGATQLKTFASVTLPLAVRHLTAGFILSLARAISEVGAVIIVAYYPKVAATLVVERFLSYGLSAALTLSAALILVSIAIFASLRLVVRGA